MRYGGRKKKTVNEQEGGKLRIQKREEVQGLTERRKGGKERAGKRREEWKGDRKKALAV